MNGRECLSHTDTALTRRCLAVLSPLMYGSPHLCVPPSYVSVVHWTLFRLPGVVRPFNISLPCLASRFVEKVIQVGVTSFFLGGCHFPGFGCLQCGPAQAQTHVAALLLRGPLVMAHVTAVPQWGALKHLVQSHSNPCKTVPAVQLGNSGIEVMEFVRNASPPHPHSPPPPPP